MTKTSPAKQAEATKRWKEKKRRDGLCEQCGKVPPWRPESTVCRECADKFKKRQEKRDRKRIADGLCTRCFVNPVESGKTNCEVCIQKAVEFNRQQRREAKIAVIGHLGGKCTGEGCQESDIRVLTLHHPDKDGAEHRRELGGRGGARMYIQLNRLLKARKPFPTKLQVLCFNCHAKKDLLAWWDSCTFGSWMGSEHTEPIKLAISPGR